MCSDALHLHTISNPSGKFGSFGNKNTPLLCEVKKFCDIVTNYSLENIENFLLNMWTFFKKNTVSFKLFF